MAFYDNLTARAVMAFFAKIRGADRQQSQALLERVGLAAAADRKADLIRSLEQDGITIRDLRTEEPTLEEIFLAYVQSDRKESLR